ncbi:hypothetical protein SLEP1_g44022 [Rubroshorea leprosula]|uniref:Small-subunit processome Utp12 domain-containing protein n=1 Tax=Rubroshorea leprosula TaxID=152421 RepID=A0AAV5LEW5_9ROSI|nr:hypothetical protein SLEP1_g44022 [Rubroshorea leprosula]
MAKQKLRSLITSFTPDGDYLAILSPDGTVKIWNTSNRSLLAEWKQSHSDPVVSYTCIACCFIGKKHKDLDSCLVVLGTSDGDIFAIDVLIGRTKWKFTGFCPSAIAGLSFTDKDHSLQIVGCNGKAFEMNFETGEILKEFKASKKPISLFSFSCDKKFLALASGKMRIISLENGKELLKFADDLDHVQYMSISDDARAIVTAGLGEKHLKLWYCDLSSKTVVSGPVLYMKQPPLALACQNNSNDVGGFVILAISESGVAYVWNLETSSEDEARPTKITVKANKAGREQEKSANSKKSRASIISARLLTNSTGKGVSACIAYGLLDSPQFSVVNVSKMGEDVVIIAGDEEETETIQENKEATGRGLHSSESGLMVDPNRKANKKRGAPDPDLETTRGVEEMGHGENMDGVLVDDDPNEPTMGEKLASLNLIDEDKTGSHGKEERQESTPVTKPPSADSVNVLLKQALHADDRALLLECLYTQDEKVIKNSISLLNPSDVLKLLHSLVSIIQSRGAVLACALPWIKNLLLQHASGIMSQESSLHSLNSLYQLIESRVSTFESALQVSSCLDFLFAGIVEDEEEENATVPVIFEDKDESDEEELSEDAMETDRDGEEEEEALDEALDGISDFEGIEDMSD